MIVTSHAPKFKAYVLAIIGSMCYGLNPLFALPLYEDGMSALAVLFYRYLFALIMIGGLMLVKRESFAINRKQAGLTVVMGFFFAACSLSLFQSFKHMDAGIASTILFTYPLFVAGIMWAVFKEKAGKATWISLGLALAGIGLLYKTDGGTLSLVGLGLVLLSSLTYAVYLVGVNRSVLKTMPALKLTFYVMLTGVILFFVLLRGGMDLPALSTPSMWINAVGLGLFPTLMSLVLVTRSIHVIGSTAASIIGAMEPLTALAVTMLFFGSRITVANGFGIALILAAVVLVVISDKD